MSTTSLRFAPLPSTRAPVRRRVAVSSPRRLFFSSSPSLHHSVSSSSSSLVATKATKGGQYPVSSEPPKGEQNEGYLALFWREFSVSFKKTFLESLALAPKLIAVGLLCVLLMMYWPKCVERTIETDRATLESNC